MFIRSIVEKKEVKPVYIATEHQLADILTKALPKASFTNLRERMNIASMKQVQVAICALAIASFYVEAQGNAKTTELESFMLSIQSPCDDLGAANEITSIDDPMIARMGAYNVYSKYICDQKYAQVLSEAMDLNGCTGVVRVRRGLPGIVIQNLGRKLTQFGVTNFIKTELKAGGMAAIDMLKKEMSHQVRARTRRFFESGLERRPLEIMDVAAVSETASSHKLDLIESNSMLMPRMSWAAFHSGRDLLPRTQT